MADYLVTDTELTSIANAIRTQHGTSNSIVFPTGYVTAISSLYDISSSTVTAGDLRTGVIAYNSSGARIVGNTDWTINVQNGSVSKISGTTADYLLTMS